MKIATKITLPLLVTVACGLLISTVITYNMSTSALENASASSQKMAIANAIVELEAGIEFNVFNAISLAQTSLFQPFLAGTEEEHLANDKDAQTRIVNMRKTYNYVMLGIANTEGKVLKHTEAEFVGRDLTKEPFFIAAMQGKVSIGNPFLFKKSIVYPVASPVYSVVDKKIIGVVYNISRLTDSMSERMHLGEKGYILVAGNDGLVFIHNDPENVLKQNLNDTDWGKEVISKESGQIIYTDKDEQKVAYYATIPGTGWHVVAAANTDELKIPSTNIRNTTIIVSSILLLCLAIAIYLCVYPITTGINRAVKYAEDIAIGNLDGFLNLKSKDELGQLAKALQQIPIVLRSILSEYKEVEKKVEIGDLTAQGNSSQFSGEFANLVKGTNSVLSHFKMIIDSIPSPVVVLDANLNAKYLNPHAVALTTTNYLDKKCGELFYREDDKSETDGLILAVKTKRPNGSETIAHPNGKEIHIKYNAIPIFNKDHQLVSILQLITDLSDIKRTQLSILNVAKQASTISERVASSSLELSQQLNVSEQNSIMQATRISETANAMQTMNETILEMSRNAKESSEASSSAKLEAEAGAQVVQKAVDSIKIVQMQSRKLKDGMSKLDESAKSITQIMGTISDIADQTNLLALNAAIEAARAGEAGRGFSVVADEVRKLAEKTMLSTSDVGKAVNIIQENISESVLQVEESVKSIEEATVFATQSGSALNTIVGMVDNAASQSLIIAAISEEQSISTEKINGSLIEVNTAADETARTMQEAAQTVVDLSKQTESLFKIIDDMKHI